MKPVRKALVIVLDGLRPDMVTPQIMPRLHRLQSEGVRLGRHRAVFPSDTRANVASLVTGSRPGAHGFPGNSFFDPALRPEGPIDASRTAVLDPVIRARGGRLYDRHTLGEVLAKHGRRLAVLGSASAGTTRLLQPDFHLKDFICLSAHDPEVMWPPSEAAAMMEQFGSLPPRAEPDLAAVEYLVNVFLGQVWPQHSPDVTLFWLNEPDVSYHAFGVGAPEALMALTFVDSQLGRLFDWAAVQKGADIQIVVASDHGHVTVRNAVDVAGALTNAGFRLGPNFESDSQIVLAPGYPSRLSLASDDRGLAQDVVETLLAQSWCGHVFSRAILQEQAIPKTFASGIMGIEGRGAPDLWLTLRSGDDTNAHGYDGWCDSAAGPGVVSMHGGLHAREMENLGILHGSAFGANRVLDIPTSICDIGPTLIKALGLPDEKSWLGRAVREAEVTSTPTHYDERIKSIQQGSRFLQFQQFEGQFYIDHGWIDPVTS